MKPKAPVGSSHPSGQTNEQWNPDTKKYRKTNENKSSVFIIQKKASLTLAKVQRFFSSIISGKEKSNQQYGERIQHIKQQLKQHKMSPSVDSRTIGQHGRHQVSEHQPPLDETVIQPATMHSQTKADPQQSAPVQTIVHQQQTTLVQTPFYPQQATLVQTPVYPQQTIFVQTPVFMQQAPAQQPLMPSYLVPMSMPSNSYFEIGWGVPQTAFTPPPQTSQPSPAQQQLTRRDPLLSDSQEVNSSPSVRNCRMGNNPDPIDFQNQVSEKLREMLAPLKNWDTPQTLHALSHVMYSSDIPPYENDKMKFVVFEKISEIEALRIDYVPNANDGSPNIYKVIFNNLLRTEIVSRLPENLRNEFLEADKQHGDVDSFKQLITDYRSKIKQALEPGESQEAEKSESPKPGQLSSEWMAKMNNALAPLREQLERWSDQDRYHALWYMLGGSLKGIDSSEKVRTWVSAANQIRNQNVYNPTNKNSNEQKIFFNNNLRSVIKNLLPTDFQAEYDAAWSLFNDPAPGAAPISYEEAKKSALDMTRKAIKTPKNSSDGLPSAA